MTPEDKLAITTSLAKRIQDPETLKTITDIFGVTPTNQNWKSIIKEREEKKVREAIPPTDLSQIDPAEHHLHDHSQLFVPEHIARYIQDCTFPTGDDERNMILTEMEKYHKTQPFTIIMDQLMERFGQTYLFIPEVAKYETGFYYLHPR